LNRQEIEVYWKKNFFIKFDFDVEIRIGAGAFVCGEETALIASVQGKEENLLKSPHFQQKGDFFVNQL
jgi:NADH:ubiquinone oxidoreductase subunit F (NADH-binding)